MSLKGIFCVAIYRPTILGCFQTRVTFPFSSLRIMFSLKTMTFVFHLLSRTHFSLARVVMKVRISSQGSAGYFNQP